MDKSEQWMLDGICGICRRRGYCNKPCKACNTRRDNVVRSAVARALDRRIGLRD